MMKFKLLFKKGHSNSSAKSESNQNQQVTAAPSTATTATLPLAGAASAARSHFENEKSSKQIKSKQQTSVKKVLNNFNKDKVENHIKNQNKVLKSSHEKIFPKEKGISSSEFSDNPIKPIEPKHTLDNLKNSVNNSTGVSSRNKFDNVSDNFNENINLAINKPHSSIPISERKNSAENSDVSPSDRKEKSNSNSSSNVVPGEILESRLGGSHALLASTAGDLKIMEYQDLKHQLDSVSNEKQMLETKINELLNYQESLKDELCKMKDIQDARLGGVGAGGATSPGGSDTPPPPLPLPTTPPPRHASAPPSIAPMEPLDAHDWDKHSSSSLSEISVACLQDRITQMEETHYCTNEELQATLQELADLQSQLVDLQHANETLSHEKSVLLESLCQQTEKLEDTRSKADTLQELLLSSNNEPNLTRLNPSERETKLVELLKSSQQEKELLIRHRDDSMAELTDLRRLSSAMKTDCERLSERVRQLESTLESRQADRVQVEDELSRSKEESSSRLLEMNRLSTLLDNARAKIEELEEDRQNLRGKSELDELLAATRKEKDGLESQVAKLQDSVSRLQCRAQQQQETVLHLTQEMKVIRNNAKSSLSDMEYERDLNQKEIQRLSHELELLQENYNELQIQVQNHLEDKRQLKSLLSETQKQLSETQNSLNMTSKRLSEESSLRCIENEEWQEFQKDLLTTVRVANEFKSETAQKLESVLIENKLLKEKNRTLSSQVEKLRTEADNNSCSKPTATTTAASSSLPLASSIRTSSDSACSAAASSVLTSVMQRNFSSHDSRLSVRSLIESIENATKQAKSGPSSSLSSSTSSLNSTTGGGGGGGGTGSSPCPSPHSPLQDPAHPHSSGAGSPCGILMSSSGKKRDLTSSMLSSTPDIVHETLKPPTSLKSEDPPSASSAAAALLESMARRNSQTDLSERKDPLQALVKNGGSRRNALLKWCQTKTLGYHNIDITNFSSSWNDGLALCAILHSYLPDRVPYDTLTPNEKRRNFTIAFNAAESVGIPTTLNTNDMITQERPDWNQVMAYVTSIYKHFET